MSAWTLSYSISLGRCLSFASLPISVAALPLLRICAFSACNRTVRRCWGLQVPYRLLKSFHKIQSRLVRELEKKFSGKDVVLIANRRIMAPPTSGLMYKSRFILCTCRRARNCHMVRRVLTSHRGRGRQCAAAAGYGNVTVKGEIACTLHHGADPRAAAATARG